MGTIEVHTPELAVDFLINRWLLYQSLSCRIWGRCRRVPARRRIRLPRSIAGRHGVALRVSRSWRESTSCLRRAVSSRKAMFSTGGIRRTAPVSARGSPTITSGFPTSSRTISGSPVMWTSCATEVPFLNAPLLEADQREDFSTPEIAREHGTLFEHCRRAVCARTDCWTHGVAPDGDRGLERWDEPRRVSGARGRACGWRGSWWMCCRA